MFRGSVKGTGYPLHSPVSPSLPLPCVIVYHHISTGVYYPWIRRSAGTGKGLFADRTLYHKQLIIYWKFVYRNGLTKLFCADILFKFCTWSGERQNVMNNQLLWHKPMQRERTSITSWKDGKLISECIHSVECWLLYGVSSLRSSICIITSRKSCLKAREMRL